MLRITNQVDIQDEEPNAGNGRYLPVFDPHEKLHITIGDKLIDNPKQIASGGTKKIISINANEVIAIICGYLEHVNQIIDGEINISNKLQEIGLHTQKYEKVIAIINNQHWPVLKMVSFNSLLQQGMQVREIKGTTCNYVGSFLFENMENLQSPQHWKLILKDIINDLYLYLIHNLKFSHDSFNLLIKNAENYYKQTSIESLLFTKDNQKIQLYFFDFNDYNCFYKFDKYYEFVDINGSIIQDNIELYVKQLKAKVENSIYSAVSAHEYGHITGKKANIAMILELARLSNGAFDLAWEWLEMNVVNKIKLHLNDMTIEERIKYYVSDKMRYAAQERKVMEYKINEESAQFNEEMKMLDEDWYSKHLRTHEIFNTTKCRPYPSLIENVYETKERQRLSEIKQTFKKAALRLSANKEDVLEEVKTKKKICQLY
jgi:hypothetical protein